MKLKDVSIRIERIWSPVTTVKRSLFLSCGLEKNFFASKVQHNHMIHHITKIHRLYLCTNNAAGASYNSLQQFKLIP